MNNTRASKFEGLLIKSFRWLWKSAPVHLARAITPLIRLLPKITHDQIWYFLAYDACRGLRITTTRSALLLPGLGLYPKNLNKISLRPPLWWALASYQGCEGEKIYSWAQQAGVPLNGRHCGYDFITASIFAKNRQAFKWGIDQGLPVDGPEEGGEDPDKTYKCVTNIESDLRTPLWHAVNLTSVSDPWWVEKLIQAGARWEYKGQGRTSAAQLDQERNLGWSQWWKRRELTKLASQQNKQNQSCQVNLPLM